MELDDAARTSGVKRSRLPDETRPQKRSRVSRACDQCRASREKCDGAQPTCQTCILQKRECSYDERPKKRGIPPNYIRTLELTLAWVFRESPELTSRLSRELPDDSPTRKLILGKDGADVLHAAWRNGIVCRQLDQLLAGLPLERPTDRSEETSSYQSPPVSALSVDITTSAHAPLSDDMEIQSKHTRHIPHGPDAYSLDLDEPHTLIQQDDQSYISDHTWSPTLVDQRSSMPLAPNAFPRPAAISDEHLQLPANAWILLEEYFAFTHCWLPMTDKQAVLKLMYTFPKSGMSTREAAVHPELWAIFGLASIYSRSNDQVERYGGLVERLMIEKIDSFGVEHVQALLILGLIYISREKWKNAWLAVGSAVRRLLVLRAASTINSSSHELATCPRTTLAAFVLETALSTRLVVPAHLTSDQLPVSKLVEDGMEEWSPWQDPANTDAASSRMPSRSLSAFNRVIRVALQAQNVTLERCFPNPGNDCMDILQTLLRNAGSENNGRRQPALLIDEIERQLDGAIMHSEGLNAPEQKHPTNGTDDPHATNRIENHAFMSIPIDTFDRTPGQSTYLQSPAASTANRTVYPSTADPFTLDLTVSGTDIFEELSLMDGTESGQDPHFMQNLGFAPDQDLAEFFGPDYQPSDPQLASLFSLDAGDQVG